MWDLYAPLSRKPLGILKYFLTQKVMKNYELSNDKKISTPYIFVILQGTVLHTFPDNNLDKYSHEKFSYTEVHVIS